MRVISQDGMMDIPYEKFVLGVSKDNCIVACNKPSGSPEELHHGIMAKYSTQEKAMKAMEMLRDEYVGKPFVVSSNYKELSDEEIKEIAKGNVTTTFDYSKYSRIESGRNNNVFQFPKDEDVEV